MIAKQKYMKKGNFINANRLFFRLLDFTDEIPYHKVY